MSRLLFLNLVRPAIRTGLVLAATSITLGASVLPGPTVPARDALKPHLAAGSVTSQACAGANIPVAPAGSVVSLSEDGSIGPPVGETLVTSAGPMHRLDISEPRGTHEVRRPDSREPLAIPSFASNAIHPDVPWYVCSSGADTGMQISPSWVLTRTIEEVTDPHFIPPYENYYPESLFTEGKQNFYWAGWFDEGRDVWVGEWIPITAGTWGPIFNEGEAMRDDSGMAPSGGRQYGMVLHGYLAIVVYRPDAIKVSPTCYEGEYEGVAVWAPPIRTCSTPIANR